MPILRCERATASDVMWPWTGSVASSSLQRRTAAATGAARSRLAEEVQQLAKIAIRLLLVLLVLVLVLLVVVLVLLPAGGLGS